MARTKTSVRQAPLAPGGKKTGGKMMAVAHKFTISCGEEAGFNEWFVISYSTWTEIQDNVCVGIYWNPGSFFVVFSQGKVSEPGHKDTKKPGVKHAEASGLAGKKKYTKPGTGKEPILQL